MNQEWAELNKAMQAQIKKKDTYKTGIDIQLSNTAVMVIRDLPDEIEIVDK